MQLSDAKRMMKYERFISSKIPCVIFSTMTKPSQDMIDMAIKYNVPTFVTERTTSSLMAEIIRWLGVQLAPCISIHGVLVDVYGEGILITGESGIGKSEAALELIKRGHRLVSDDVVELRKVSDVTLVGSAPDITRHFIELRGIGIIDVKTLFGVESVKDTQSVDLVIKLEEWDRDKEYDRLGLHEEYTEYLGNKIVCHSLPIRPGRNLAVIVESAAVNHRQKKMGYNAAEELYKRVQANICLLYTSTYSQRRFYQRKCDLKQFLPVICSINSCSFIIRVINALQTGKYTEGNEWHGNKDTYKNFPCKICTRGRSPVYRAGDQTDFH